MSETIVKAKNRRYPWLAVMLSLIMPGLGQIYCGKIVRGLLLTFLASLPLSLITLLLSMQKTPFMLAIVLVGLFTSMLVQLIAIIDSGYIAKHTRPDYELKDYNRWYVYVLLVFMGVGGAMETATHIKTNYIEAFRVPMASCYPTIVPNDRILANKSAYKTKDPRRGDTIVFICPENRQWNWIKRVIAVAGDTIEIKDGELYVNDEKLLRQKLAQSVLDSIRVKVKGKPLEGDIFEETNGDAKYKILLATSIPEKAKTSPDFPKTTVPKYHCFVLGDNRNNSRDSRHVGPIPLATIKGRADYLYCPAKDWSRFGKLD